MNYEDRDATIEGVEAHNDATKYDKCHGARSEGHAGRSTTDEEWEPDCEWSEDDNDATCCEEATHNVYMVYEIFCRIQEEGEFVPATKVKSTMPRDDQSLHH